MRTYRCFPQWRLAATGVLRHAAQQGPLPKQSMEASIWQVEQHQSSMETDFRYTKMMGTPLATDELVVDKRCYGIPFKIDDAKALDAAMQHHQTAVRLVGVERLMMPFWLGASSVGGQFRAEVLQQDPYCLSKTSVTWYKTPMYDFSYPFEEHFYFNQISASYLYSNSMLEGALAGDHVPSMLLSRFELLEELEELKVTPTMIPFVMSSATAVQVLSARVTRERVETIVYKELRKYHGNYHTAVIRFKGFFAEALRLRPVYLPMFRLQVATASHATPVTTLICGVTGKASGPVIHLTNRTKVWTGFSSGLAAAAISSIAFEPALAACIALATSAGSLYAAKALRISEALRVLALGETEVRAKGAINYESDQQGWRWSVEEEERHEFEYREELRSKARNRADFERRVREEADKEQAMNDGKTFNERSKSRGARSKGVPGTVNYDPLGYYVILGLKGKETSATGKEIAKAFRIEAQKSHPDLSPVDKKEEAHKTMQKLLEAYTVLRDTKLRKEYDLGLLTLDLGGK